MALCFLFVRFFFVSLGFVFLLVYKFPLSYCPPDVLTITRIAALGLQLDSG